MVRSSGALAVFEPLALLPEWIVQEGQPNSLGPHVPETPLRPVKGGRWIISRMTMTVQACAFLANLTVACELPLRLINFTILQLSFKPGGKSPGVMHMTCVRFVLADCR